MTKIVSENLPNAVSVADVSDVIVRNKLMLMIENEKKLKSQIAELQKAVVELQRR